MAPFSFGLVTAPAVTPTCPAACRTRSRILQSSPQKLRSRRRSSCCPSHLPLQPQAEVSNFPRWKVWPVPLPAVLQVQRLALLLEPLPERLRVLAVEPDPRLRARHWRQVLQSVQKHGQTEAGSCGLSISLVQNATGHAGRQSRRILSLAVVSASRCRRPRGRGTADESGSAAR